MSVRRWAVVLAAATAWLAPAGGAAQRPRLTIDVRYTPAANLLYQLDCVTGVIQACATNDYHALWSREFAHTAGDSARLSVWSTLRRRYTVPLTPVPPAGDTTTTRPLDVSDKVRLAGLQSTDIDDLLPRLELLLSPADWLTAREVITAFRPAFMAWWSREALPGGTPFVTQMTALLASDTVSSLIDRFARFYNTDYPLDAGVPLQLYFRPELKPSGTSGQQIERYAMLEFLRNEAPNRRVDVAVHELCHFFFGVRSLAAQQALDARFRQSKSPAASAAHNLLNEGLATALGNGILARTLSDSTRWRRLLATPLAFYNNPYIDRAARVLMTMLDARLAGTGSIDDEDFVTAYIASVDAAFGTEATAPRLLLNELYAFTDSSLGDSVPRMLRATIRPSSVYGERGVPERASYSDLLRQPDINAVIVIRPQSLAALRSAGVLTTSQLQSVQRRVRGRRYQLHVLRRPTGAWLFLLVARDAAAASDVLKALGTLDRATESR